MFSDWLWSRRRWSYFNDHNTYLMVIDPLKYGNILVHLNIHYFCSLFITSNYFPLKHVYVNMYLLGNISITLMVSSNNLFPIHWVYSYSSFLDTNSTYDQLGFKLINRIPRNLVDRYSSILVQNNKHMFFSYLILGMKINDLKVLDHEDRNIGYVRQNSVFNLIDI